MRKISGKTRKLEVRSIFWIDVLMNIWKDIRTWKAFVCKPIMPLENIKCR